MIDLRIIEKQLSQKKWKPNFCHTKPDATVKRKDVNLTLWKYELILFVQLFSIFIQFLNNNCIAYDKHGLKVSTQNGIKICVANADGNRICGFGGRKKWEKYTLF